MPPVSFARRQDIAVRLTGGQQPSSIATILGVGVKTVYRLRRQFRQPDGTFQAVAASVATKEAFSREQLVEVSEWLTAEPKLTLAELRQKTVDEGFFGTLEEVPDQSTLYRQLKKMGFNWGKVRYSDPRAKRSVIKYERLDKHRTMA